MSVQSSRPPDLPGSIPRTRHTVGARQRRVWWLIIVLVATLLAAILARPLLAAVYLSYGSYALVQAHAAPNRPDLLAQATLDLKRASGIAPGNPLALRRLAEAHILAGRHTAAIDALNRALQLQPDSLLTLYALALAYESAGQSADALALWGKAGFAPANFADLARASFQQGNHTDALTWYARAELSGYGLGRADRFRQVISAVITGDPKTRTYVERLCQLAPDAAPQTVGQHGRVNGSELLLITAFSDLGADSGTRLDEAFALTGNQPPDSEGLLWRNGEAVAIFEVPTEGAYSLRADLRHRGPPPAEYLLGLDGRLLQQGYISDDQGWTAVEVNVTLAPGLHTVHLHFVNEQPVQGGLDRGLLVRSIELK